MSLNEPEPEARRNGPPLWLVVVIAILVVVIVALHLTGVVGPG